MVRIVLAGGAGNVGREVLEALIQKGTHDLTVYTRSDAPDLKSQGVKVVAVDYTDKGSLVSHLQGVHTVLCFITGGQDGVTLQKNLIDASIEAGVKRYAPSEWAARSKSGILSYATKDVVHEYLQEINKDKKVLEYTLFQPGLFMNYLSAPYPSTKHMANFVMQWDLHNRRAIVPAEVDYPLTLTTVQDLGKVVAEAVDYEGEWPETGGITGTKTTNSELLKLAEKLRGPMKIESVSRSDLESGKLNTSWVPIIEHTSLPPEYRTAAVSEGVIASILLGGVKGAWEVSDDWNKLLPQVKFTQLEDFLEDIFKGKP